MEQNKAQNMNNHETEVISPAGPPVAEQPVVAYSGSTIPDLGFELKPGWNILPAEELPMPTYWPVAMALAIALFAFGFVAGYIVIIVALVLFVLSLVGWIGDLQNEQPHGH